MDKRAQITVFVVVGMGILFVTGILIYLTQREVGEVEVPETLDQLSIYVEGCIKQVADPGVHLLASQGGYIYYSESFVSTYYSDIQNGFLFGRSVLPKIIEMEMEMADYISNTLPFCTNFSTLPDFEIEEGKVTTIARVMEDMVLLDISYPIKAKRGDKEKTFDKFSLEVPLRLGYLHSIAKETIESIILDPEWIDFTSLASYDVDVNLVPHNESTLIYAISDNSSKEPLIFMFAAQFYVNQDPVIEFGSVVWLDDGEVFVSRVNVTDPEGDDVVLSDDTAMFDITSDGVIAFTPEIPGRYNVTIRAEDIHGNYDEKYVLFIVREVG